jgi:hypothetical protein
MRDDRRVLEQAGRIILIRERRRHRDGGAEREERRRPGPRASNADRGNGEDESNEVGHAGACLAYLSERRAGAKRSNVVACGSKPRRTGRIAFSAADRTVCSRRNLAKGARNAETPMLAACLRDRH